MAATALEMFVLVEFGNKKEERIKNNGLNEISVTDLYEMLMCDVAFELSGDKQNKSPIFCWRGNYQRSLSHLMKDTLKGAQGWDSGPPGLSPAGLSTTPDCLPLSWMLVFALCCWSRVCLVMKEQQDVAARWREEAHSTVQAVGFLSLSLSVFQLLQLLSQPGWRENAAPALVSLKYITVTS